MVVLVLLIFNTLLYIKKSESTKVITKKEDKKEVEEVVVEKAIAEKIEVPKREENKKGRESIYKAKMTENFRNLEREINIQIHEAKRISQ